MQAMEVAGVISMETSKEIPAATALRTSLTRLLDLIDEENAVLRLHKIVSHAGFTDRKNQALRELSAARRLVLGAEITETCRPELQRLALALNDNATLLKRHIIAVGEVSDIIIAGLRDENSDGTYARNAASDRRFQAC
jgi:hypothetical protein